MYRFFQLDYDHMLKIKIDEFEDFCNTFDSLFIFLKLQEKYEISDFRYNDGCFNKMISFLIRSRPTGCAIMECAFMLDLDLSVINLIIRQDSCYVLTQNHNFIDKNEIKKFNLLLCSYVEKIKLLPTLLD